MTTKLSLFALVKIWETSQFDPCTLRRCQQRLIRRTTGSTNVTAERSSHTRPRRPVHAFHLTRVCHLLSGLHVPIQQLSCLIARQIGRASCRERVWQSVWISVG